MTETCETPNELINYVGTAPYVIKLQTNDRNATDCHENPKLIKRENPFHFMLLNFVTWRVPSDFYLLSKPGWQCTSD